SWLIKKPIAHRGLSDEENPENSLAAFSRAIEKGFPIELDVRLIDDGTVVVFHDETLGRMTEHDGYVSTLKADDLKELRLKKSDECIPTLEQTLSLVNGQVPLLIEIKGTGKIGALENKTISLLKAYSGEYAIQSFDPYSLAYFKEHEPDIMRGQLSAAFGKKSGIPFFKRKALSQLKVTNISAPHFISYCFSDLPNKYVAKKGLFTLAWTIRSNADYEQVKEHCDNIIFERFLPNT
ncbi:MAG: glycerophosphodiester phosphodiesterase, partial [Clostridiales bacterium]|nr:glycerophosphodiester phosphodiesterase [Clostridiales bacterium]